MYSARILAQKSQGDHEIRGCTKQVARAKEARTYFRKNKIVTAKLVDEPNKECAQKWGKHIAKFWYVPIENFAWKPQMYSRLEKVTMNLAYLPNELYARENPERTFDYKMNGDNENHGCTY